MTVLTILAVTAGTLALLTAGPVGLLVLVAVIGAAWLARDRWQTIMRTAAATTAVTAGAVFAAPETIDIVDRHWIVNLDHWRALAIDAGPAALVATVTALALLVAIPRRRPTRTVTPLDPLIRPCVPEETGPAYQPYFWKR